MKQASIRILATLGLMTGACGRAPVEGPPEIRFGQDECDHCGMIISDPRCAAGALAIVGGKRTHLRFDDIGDLIDYEAEHPEISIQHRFVNDYLTRKWLDASQVHFVQSGTLHTPMGSGIIAHAASETALTSAQEHQGIVLTYAQAVSARRR